MLSRKKTLNTDKIRTTLFFSLSGLIVLSQNTDVSKKLMRFLSGTKCFLHLPGVHFGFAKHFNKFKAVLSDVINDKYLTYYVYSHIPSRDDVQPGIEVNVAFYFLD